MTVEFRTLSRIFNALVPNTVNKSPRLIFFENGWFGVAKLPRALDNAARDGDIDEVKRLLDKGANPNLVTHFSGPAIKEAARSGDVNVVKLLAERGADVNGVDTANGTALHAAISDLRYNHVKEQSEIIDYLLSKGARQDIKNSCNDTPLEWARQLDDHHAERQLAAAAGIDLKDELKPFLQTDGSYAFDAKLNDMGKSVRIEIPDFRDFKQFASVEGDRVMLLEVGESIARFASEIFGLENVHVSYTGDAKDGYKMQLFPAEVWQANAEREAQAQRLFDDLIHKGLPSSQDIQPMKPLAFKPKTP